MKYDAFISYSHAADGKLARDLQSALHRLAKPWYKARALNIYRDETGFGLTPQLWPEIQEALARSDFFLLLGSPEAARSEWVRREIEFWLTHCDTANFLLVCTAGDVVWDQTSGDFDWQRTSALPDTLSGVFAQEPFYGDLRRFRRDHELSLKHGEFAREVARIAAPLHGKEPFELLSEEVQQAKRAHRLAWMGGSLLATVVAVSIWFAAQAELQRRFAASRELAADALTQIRTNPKRGLELASKAIETHPTSQAEEALRKTLFSAARLHARIEIPGHRHDRSTWSLAFSSDAKRVVAADRRSGRVKVLDLAAHSIDDRIVEAFDVAVTNGDFLLTFNYSKHEAIVWNVAAGTAAATLEGLREQVVTAALSADGRIVFFTTRDNHGRLWNLDTNSLISLERSVSTIVRATISPDNNFLITLDRPNWNAKLWNARTGALIRDLPGASSSLGTPVEVTLAQFSPDGRHIATACGFGAGCYEHPVISNGRVIGGRDVTGDGVAEFDGTVKVWEKSGETFVFSRSLRVDDRVYDLAFDSSSRLIGAASGDKIARVWEVNTGKLVSNFVDHTGWVWDIAFSPDGDVGVTTGSKDGTARVWDVDTGRELLVLAAHEQFVEEAVFSSDGKFLLTVDEGLATVWNLRLGRAAEEAEVARIDGSPRIVRKSTILSRLPDDARQTLLSTSNERWNAGVFSPDGSLLATFSVDEQSYVAAQIWQAGSGQLVRSLRRYKDGVRSAAFSKGGEYIALADRFGSTVRTWKIDTGLQVDLPGHVGQINTLEFSPNSACLVSGGGSRENETVRVWHTNTGSLLDVFWGYAGGMRKAAFKSGGKFVITEDGTGGVRMAATDGCAFSEELLALSKRHFERIAKTF